MKEFIVWLIICVALLCGGAIGIAKAAEQTSCSIWANFGKTIAFKYRDTGTSLALVRRAVLSVMQSDPELHTALRYVDYVYTNPTMTDSQVWLGVYEDCRLKATL